MSDPFFQSLNYSAAHEDGASELRALATRPTDRVVCIAGSGARPLELLLGDPREVIAVDMNPAQLALLDLKIAAMRMLNHDQLLAFLGVRKSSARRSIYVQLRSRLALESRRFWDGRLRVIDRGVLYAGSWDRRLRLFSRLFSLTRRGLRDRLFACESVDEQAELWRRRWDNRTWELMLRTIFSRLLWHRFSDEPGAAFVPESTDVPAYLIDRFRRAASAFLFRDSAWAWLAFYGRYRADLALPLYLQTANYGTICARLDRIRCVRAPLTEYLESNGGIDAFSISDVSSYMTRAEHQRCWRAILLAANAGARICERRFLVRYDMGVATSLGLRRDPSLECSLDASDQSIVYDFVCGEVDSLA
jgi:S-adenosylmethionine-diacylglycerol 3-amino-3-carboxypropyl transferase